MPPGGNQGTAAAEPLEALREKWARKYDIGTFTVTDKSGPIVLWTALRLHGTRQEPLLGFDASALDAAMRGDWGKEP